MPNIPVTIGRKMYFWPARSEYEQGLEPTPEQPEDATVCYVNPDGTVNLAVHNRMANARRELGVRVRQPEDGNHTRPYVDWMPFQVGQAKAAT
jgi:hypothetical protein